MYMSIYFYLSQWDPLSVDYCSASIFTFPSNFLGRKSLCLSTRMSKNSFFIKHLTPCILVFLISISYLDQGKELQMEIHFLPHLSFIYKAELKLIILMFVWHLMWHILNTNKGHK